MKYQLLNVFSPIAHSGNQLAVVFPNQELTDQKMQEITSDFNFSETVFIHDHKRLRIFSPGGELPFAGHPTIGAAWAIFHNTGQPKFNLETLRGTIPVEVNANGAFLTFPGQPMMSPYIGESSVLLKAAGAEWIDIEHQNIRVLNTGPEIVLIPIKTLNGLRSLKAPRENSLGLRLYFVFQESDTIYHVRMFSPKLGLGEDAATGSAACALGAYLRDLKQQPQGNIKIFQGTGINRPSEIELRWNTEIQLGGHVRLWGEGLLKN